jgi:hypothetical protein
LSRPRSAKNLAWAAMRWSWTSSLCDSGRERWLAPAARLTAWIHKVNPTLQCSATTPN